MLSGEFFRTDSDMPSIAQLYFDFISLIMFPISVVVVQFKVPH